MNAVELENVTKTFGGVAAVNSLTLAVPQGSIYGFIGPNGSGKTTTMRMIVNIFYPDSGGIQVFGETLHGTRSEKIGYLPEERGLYRKMTVQALLEFYGELRGGRNVTNEVRAWLDKFDLLRCAEQKLETLSKGMSQKVQFIAAIVAAPKLLILDEPFSGLDPVSADLLRDTIRELRGQGSTIILSTHDMPVAEAMCDRICMIFRGNKVLDGTLDSIQGQYGNDTIHVSTANGTAAFTGLPGIERVRDLGQMKELRMSQGADPQEVLRALMARTPITSFSIARPSLHDIFVRIAGPAAEEAAKEASNA